MHVAMGASWQMGAAVMEALLAQGLPARAVVRRPDQTAARRARGADAALVDAADQAVLSPAFGIHPASIAWRV